VRPAGHDRYEWACPAWVPPAGIEPATTRFRNRPLVLRLLGDVRFLGRMSVYGKHIRHQLSAVRSTRGSMGREQLSDSRLSNCRVTRVASSPLSIATKRVSSAGVAAIIAGSKLRNQCDRSIVTRLSTKLPAECVRFAGLLTPTVCFRPLVDPAVFHALSRGHPLSLADNRPGFGWNARAGRGRSRPTAPPVTLMTLYRSG
jgi:hypothetical protein